MTKQIKMTFKEIVNKRRSIRIYDENAEFNADAVKRSLELAVLSPNSSNMQLWEFYRVRSEDKKKALAKACMNQSAARTATEMVVFVVRQDHYKAHAQWNLEQNLKDDKVNVSPKRVKQNKQYYGKIMPLLYRNDWFGISTFIRKCIEIGFRFKHKPIMRFVTHADQRVVLHKSCALAAQTFMLAMTAEGYDTCPMEGFDGVWVRKILNLPSTAEITMVISCGKGKPEGVYNERLRLPNENVIFEI
jgi:nitroreductase